MLNAPVRAAALAVSLALIGLVPAAALAGDKAAKHAEIDSEHLFGFTVGSDLGKAGELEAEAEGTGGFGKRDGRYTAWSNVYQLKYSVTDNFRIAPYIASTHHSISGVTGIDDHNGSNFRGGGVEFKYRVLNRKQDPFGMTLMVDPHGNRIDGFDGSRVRQHGAAIAVIFDKELVKDRIFAAFNVVYEPEWTRVVATGDYSKDSHLGLAGAMTVQVRPGLFLGGEARYLRRYDGITLNSFVGDAFFVGPTLHAELSERWNMNLAWSIQVAGHAVGESGALDLTNHERHQARIRFGYNVPVHK